MKPKYRIAKKIYEDNSRVYVPQRKRFGLFWRPFFEYKFYGADLKTTPIGFDTYEAARAFIAEMIKETQQRTLKRIDYYDFEESS